MWKVRKGWFQSVMSYIGFGLRKGWLSQDIHKEYGALDKYVDSTDFRNRMTMREDIDRANNLLDRAITDISVSGV